MLTRAARHNQRLFLPSEVPFMAPTLWGGRRQRVKSWTGGRLAFGRTGSSAIEIPVSEFNAAFKEAVDQQVAELFNS